MQTFEQTSLLTFDLGGIGNTIYKGGLAEWSDLFYCLRLEVGRQLYSQMSETFDLTVVFVFFEPPS